uniref:Uncharacterized protein n=1 Tax=Rhizophora mucronata TaxID=61149 RepID=A0A2P2QRB5_RHIMU
MSSISTKETTIINPPHRTGSQIMAPNPPYSSKIQVLPLYCTLKTGSLPLGPYIWYMDVSMPSKKQVNDL